MHDTAWYLSLALVFGVFFVFLTVFLRSRKPADYEVVQSKASTLRRRFFWTLLVLGGVLTAISTVNLPYSETHGGGAPSPVTVDVTGVQWTWLLSRTEVPVDTPIVFNVSSNDVNHGLGVYDESLQLLGQTQAMPGYVNKLRMSFDSPGTYKLLCLEYCGLGHHFMVSDLTVTESP